MWSGVNRPMLLQGKKLLITGVLTPQSIAFSIAEQAQQEGAEVILTSFGRPMSLTQRTREEAEPGARRARARRHQPRALPRAHEDAEERWGRLDGVAPRDRLRA